MCTFCIKRVYSVRHHTRLFLLTIYIYAFDPFGCICEASGTLYFASLKIEVEIPMRRAPLTKIPSLTRILLLWMHIKHKHACKVSSKDWSMRFVEIGTRRLGQTNAFYWFYYENRSFDLGNLRDLFDSCNSANTEARCSKLSQSFWPFWLLLMNVKGHCSSFMFLKVK